MNSAFSVMSKSPGRGVDRPKRARRSRLASSSSLASSALAAGRSSLLIQHDVAGAAHLRRDDAGAQQLRHGIEQRFGAGKRDHQMMLGGHPRDDGDDRGTPGAGGNRGRRQTLRRSTAPGAPRPPIRSAAVAPRRAPLPQTGRRVRPRSSAAPSTSQHIAMTGPTPRRRAARCPPEIRATRRRRWRCARSCRPRRPI